MAVAVAVVHVEPKQLWLFGLLLACGAVSVELTRRAGQTGGVVRDVYAIWDLPVALLLPPVYVLLVPIPRMLLTQARIRQTPLRPPGLFRGGSGARLRRRVRRLPPRGVGAWHGARDRGVDTAGRGVRPASARP